MTKAELIKAFKNQVASKGFTPAFDDCPDNEMALVGRYCRFVDLDSGAWDLWVLNSRDPVRALGTGKRNNIVTGMADRLNPAAAPHTLAAATAWGEWHLADGESWSRKFTPDDILQCLQLLGIRRKKIVSDEQRAAAATRFMAARNIQANQSTSEIS